MKAETIIHCRSKSEAEKLLRTLEERINEYSLTLHPEKTKVVYCKNYQRNEDYDECSFTFLSYTFVESFLIWEGNYNNV